MWFLLFGWGTSSKTWNIVNGQQIMATWHYFNLFFFPIASNIRWHFIADKRSEDREITYQEAEQLSGISNLNIGRWQQYGLMYATGYLIVSTVLVSLWGPAIYIVIPLAVGYGMYMMLEEKKWRMIFLYTTLDTSALLYVVYWLTGARVEFFDPFIILGTVLLAALVALVVVIIWKGIASKQTSRSEISSRIVESESIRQ